MGYKINGYVAGLDLLKSTSNNRNKNFISFSLFRGCSFTHVCGGRGVHVCHGLDCIPLKFTVWSPNPQCFRVWLYLATGLLKRQWSKWGHQSGLSSNVAGVLLRRGDGIQTQRGETTWRQKRQRRLQAQLRDLPKNYPASPPIPDLQPPGLRESKLLLCKPPRLRSSVMAALENWCTCVCVCVCVYKHRKRDKIIYK